MAAAPVDPAFVDLYALAVQARHTVITRLLTLIAAEKYREDQRKLLALLLRATCSPVLSARQSPPRNPDATPNATTHPDPKATPPVHPAPNGTTLPKLPPSFSPGPNGATQPEPRATPWVHGTPNHEALKGRPNAAHELNGSTPPLHPSSPNSAPVNPSHPGAAPNSHTTIPNHTNPAPLAPPARPSPAAALLAAAGATTRPP